ncbi:hypothetical protein J437_LFUL010603, partial [Ladona fulva]
MFKCRKQSEEVSLHEYLTNSNVIGSLAFGSQTHSIVWQFLTVLESSFSKGLDDVGFRHLEEEAWGDAKRGARWGGGNSRKSTKEKLLLAKRSRSVGTLPPVFPNGWFSLLDSKELLPGEVKQVSALGENFAVFREKNGGQVHVLDAYCPHLGANMAAGGAVRGDCLECPFHGWRFRGSDGKCAAVPYSSKVPDFARVKCWPSCEVNNIVFVWYHAEDEEPSWKPSSIPEVEKGAWSRRGYSRFHVNCHIQEIPENGADVAHLNAVHAPLLTSGNDLRTNGGSKFASHVWFASWSANQEEGLKHTAMMNLRHELRLFNKFLLMGNDVKAHQIGPGYVVLDIETMFGKLVILQTVTPVEPMLQRVVHRMYAPRFVLQPFASFVFLGETIMFERDVMVWNHKAYLDKPTLVSEDRAITRYRRWYSQFYSEKSPRLTYQKERSLE